MKLLTKITLGAFALPAMQVVAQTTKPNIILIMTDQQSYNAISAHADMYGGSYFSTVIGFISATIEYCSHSILSKHRTDFGFVGLRTLILTNTILSAEHSGEKSKT